MRKNGSRLISLRQYRLTDLFLFAAILVVFDLLAHYAIQWFGVMGNIYTFTLTVPITLLIMMRWGWVSVFYAVGDGILISLINSTRVWQSYLCYSVGFSFIMLLLLMVKFMGKEKIAGKWYFTVLFAFLGWLLTTLGTSAMFAIVNGASFFKALLSNVLDYMFGLISLAMAIVLLLVFRKLDGMLEDQKHYLLRLDAERREKMRRDEFGDEPVEIDEETMSILRKKGDEEYK